MSQPAVDTIYDYSRFGCFIAIWVLEEVEASLTWLAVDKKVTKSTQNQTFNALLFLYRDVFKCPLEGRINAVRSRNKDTMR